MPTNSGEYVSIESSNTLPTPGSAGALIAERFDETLAVANEMLELLVGADGESGYLGELNEAIAAAPTYDIDVDEVSTDLSVTDIGAAPTFTETLAEYPSESYAEPSLDDIPTVDTSELTPETAPDEVNPTITWSESSLSTDVYTDLLARIQSDLTSGSTGLDASVEAAIQARAEARQDVINERAYNKVLNDVASRNFSMPSGALAAAVNEIAVDQLREESDLNRTILIEQGNLAQKNSQFIIQQAVALDGLIRDSRDKSDKNQLEYARAVADNLLRTYSEKIRAYVAKLEGKKAYIEAQVAYLRGVVDSNKGKIEVYKEKYQALATRISAVVAENKGKVDVFATEVGAYGEKARAVEAQTRAQAEAIRQAVEYARVKVQAATEEIKANLGAYTSENSMRSEVAQALANIAAQSVASAFSAVNASASYGYQGSEGKTETWSHSDRLNESYNHDVD